MKMNLVVLLLAMWCCVSSAPCMAAESEQVVIADFETGADGFPTLWLSSDTTEHKVGKTSGRIRLGPLPLPFKHQRTPRTVLVHKSLAGVAELNREVSSVQFWAKSTEISAFEVQLRDGRMNVKKFPVTGFQADGQWHQVTIDLGQTWRSPVTEISLTASNENQEQEKFLWIDHITATVGAKLPEGLPVPVAKRLLDIERFKAVAVPPYFWQEKNAS